MTRPEILGQVVAGATAAWVEQRDRLPTSVVVDLLTDPKAVQLYIEDRHFRLAPVFSWAILEDSVALREMVHSEVADALTVVDVGVKARWLDAECRRHSAWIGSQEVALALSDPVAGTGIDPVIAAPEAEERAAAGSETAALTERIRSVED